MGCPGPGVRDADIYLARCGPGGHAGSFPLSHLPSGLRLLGLAARWLCSKYSEKGKRYSHKFGT